MASEGRQDDLSILYGILEYGDDFSEIFHIRRLKSVTEPEIKAVSTPSGDGSVVVLVLFFISLLPDFKNN